MILAGRLNAAQGAELAIAYVDEGIDVIPLGDDRYFVFEVPAERRASARAHGFRLIARDDEGSIIATASVPADWDDPAGPDAAAPLFVSTRSDESDLTKVDWVSRACERQGRRLSSSTTAEGTASLSRSSRTAASSTRSRRIVSTTSWSRGYWSPAIERVRDRLETRRRRRLVARPRARSLAPTTSCQPRG